MVTHTCTSSKGASDCGRRLLVTWWTVCLVVNLFQGDALDTFCFVQILCFIMTKGVVTLASIHTNLNRSRYHTILALLACVGLLLTWLCEVKLCKALKNCLIFLTSTTWLRCDLLHDMTKCKKDCGCNTPINGFTVAPFQIHNVLPAAFDISHLMIPPPSCRWQASIKDSHADHVMVRAASDVSASRYDCCC